MHAHGPGHSHSHAHGGSPRANANESRARSRRRLSITLGLAATYMVAEAVGGWWTGSLALLADAGHMLSDVTALALSLFAIWIAQRPADRRRTFGYSRAEILAALGHGAALVVVALLVASEAIERLASEAPAVDGGTAAAVAFGGLIINGIGLFILSAGRHESLNVRGAWLHVMSDALGSIAAIASGVAIWWADWRWADPLASLAICALVLWSAWHLLRAALDILMETVPSHLDVGEIREALLDLPDVMGLHDLHVWTIGSQDVALSSHVVAREESDSREVLGAVQDVLAKAFSIRHATIQIEAGTGAEADCDAGCDPTSEPGASLTERKTDGSVSD